MMAPNGDIRCCFCGGAGIAWDTTLGHACERCSGIMGRLAAERGGMKPQLQRNPGETFDEALLDRTGRTRETRRRLMRHLCRRLEGGSVACEVMHLPSGGTRIVTIAGEGDMDLTALDQALQPTPDTLEWLMTMSEGPGEHDVTWFNMHSGLSSLGDQVLMGPICLECQEVQFIGRGGLCAPCEAQDEADRARLLDERRQQDLLHLDQVRELAIPAPV